MQKSDGGVGRRRLLWRLINVRRNAYPLSPTPPGRPTPDHLTSKLFYG
jgi:hypothetical protein